SRETAPYSELKAGVQIVIAKNIEKIYGQNCQNIGLLTSTDFALIPRLLRGEAIPIDEFTKGLDPSAAEVVRDGGLFAYNPARLGDAAARGGDGQAADDAVREDHQPARDRRREDRPARHPCREAWRRAVRAHRRAVLARVRDADGRGAVPDGARRGREDHRPAVGVRVPRPPDVPRPRDAQGARRDGAARTGRVAGDG